MEKEQTLTYKSKTSKADLMRYCKAIALPIGVLLLNLFAISKFAIFGTKVMAPLSAAMWIFGVICAFFLPSHRNSLLTETHATLMGYTTTLLVLRALISLISGVSSEALMASFGQAIPLTSGSAMSGYLQMAFWAAAVGTPVGFIFMQGKKLYSFKRKGNKETFLKRLRSIRNDNHEHTK